jgi:hypothetical protein
MLVKQEAAFVLLIKCKSVAAQQSLNSLVQGCSVGNQFQSKFTLEYSTYVNLGVGPRYL